MKKNTALIEISLKTAIEAPLSKRVKEL